MQIQLAHQRRLVDRRRPRWASKREAPMQVGLMSVVASAADCVAPAEWAHSSEARRGSSGSGRLEGGLVSAWVRQVGARAAGRRANKQRMKWHNLADERASGRPIGRSDGRAISTGRPTLSRRSGVEAAPSKQASGRAGERAQAKASRSESIIGRPSERLEDSNWAELSRVAEVAAFSAAPKRLGRAA